MIKLLILASILAYGYCSVEINQKFIVRECRQNNCTGPLNECILDECNSEPQCRECINRYHPECNSCVNDIFNSTSTFIDDVEYQLCEVNSEIQVKACEFYCRAIFKTRGVCRSIQGVDVCDCYQGIQTTKRPDTTTLGRVAVLIRTLNNHTNETTSLELLSDGTLASGSKDRLIKLWNPYSGQLLATLDGHFSFVDSLLLLSNGNLASGSDDFYVNIWNVSTRTVIRFIRTVGRVLAMEQLPSSTRIAVTEGGSVAIYDYSTGVLFRRMGGHSSLVRDIKLLSNGNLASCSNDKTIRIWSLSTYQSIRTITGHNDSVVAIQELGDRTLASASSDSEIIVWNVNNGEKLRSRKLFSEIFSLGMLANFDLVAGSNGEIYVLNPTSLATINIIKGHNSPVNALETLSNGNLATGAEDIKTWFLNY